MRRCDRRKSLKCYEVRNWNYSFDASKITSKIKMKSGTKTTQVLDDV